MPRFWPKSLFSSKKPNTWLSYHEQLVRLDALSKSSDAYARLWCEELVRVHDHGQHVLTTLASELADLPGKMKGFSQPLALRRAKQCMATHLRSAWLDDGQWDHSREKSFEAHFDTLLTHLVTQLNLVNPSESALVKLVCHIERDLFLCAKYLETQLRVLGGQHQPMTVAQQTRWERVQAVQHHCTELYATFSQLLSPPSLSPSTTSIATIDDVTCAICLCVFSEPVTLLQCQHTFCRGCLLQHVETSCRSAEHRRSFSKNKMLKCPLCRSTFPNSPAAWFPNLDLAGFIASYFFDSDSARVSPATSSSASTIPPNTASAASLPTTPSMLLSSTPPPFSTLTGTRVLPKRPRSTIGAAFEHLKWVTRRQDASRRSSRPSSMAYTHITQDLYDLSRQSWMI